MKKLPLLLLTLTLLFALCACGAQDASDNTDTSSVDGTSFDPDAVPEVCRVYMDYAAPFIVDTDSQLPLASTASRGAPDYLPLWHEGEYSQLAANGGEGYTMAELTDGRAAVAGDYGRFAWDGKRYHCIHVQAKDSFIPDLVSTSGGILWLELEGDCRADNGTGSQIGMFGGFDTVIITGRGTLTLAQHIESGASQQPWPALIVEGVDVTVPGLYLNANSAPDSVANLVVQLGSLTVEDMAFVTGDACVAGGALTVGQLMDCDRLVCWGGETTLTDGWGFSEDCHQVVTPTVFLNGGTFRADSWMPDTIQYQLWEGSITAPGVRNWPGTHLLGGDVAITDPLDTQSDPQ